MPDKGLHVQQNENVDRGRLQVNVTSTLGLQPVVNARVGIAYTGESQRLLEELETDSSGQTEAVTLDAPPVEYSQEPDRPQPFSEYTVTVQAEGYRSVEVSAIDVFANVTALQEIRMEPLDISQKEGTENIVVPPNTLWGDFPPKIPVANIVILCPGICRRSIVDDHILRNNHAAQHDFSGFIHWFYLIFRNLWWKISQQSIWWNNDIFRSLFL